MIGKLNLLKHKILKLIRVEITKRQVGSYQGKFWVNGPTRLSSTTHIGKNVHFNGMMVNGVGEVHIGDNFHSGTNCLIITSIHNYDLGTKIPYDATHIEKPVIIGDNVWLGDKVTILGKVTIGEGAIIQAGAVVIKDIPPGGIAGGNPAKVFKSRDMNHYNELKSKGMFH